jgi:hypothetical protein
MVYRDGLKVYEDNVYLAQYKSPWVKLRISHTQDDKEFEDENFKAALIHNDMNFYKEKLQTISRVALVGFWAPMQLH